MNIDTDELEYSSGGRARVAGSVAAEPDRPVPPPARRPWPMCLVLPAGQPAWCRPVLLALAALAGVLYGWRMNGDGLEPYYAAAVRSMSSSWHDFLFGAFDPDGTMSLDKLPGAFWLQALSVRLFGVHVWAMALPQLVEGVLAVLVLYRAVRRLSGPVPAILSAAVLAVSPATVLLNRGNISDSLLILCLVLAADAMAAAVCSGRVWPLLLAGFWVGLGFQAKMAEAWLVLPALAVPYAVAAPLPLRARLIRIGVAGAVTAVVSLSFMMLVTATPAADRPYVDGSADNSIFEQVFRYNGTDRFNPDNSLERVARIQAATIAPALYRELVGVWPRPGAARLLDGSYGRNTGWLLPLAGLALVGVLVARRRAGRTDPQRAAVLMWGIWLVTFVAVFSVVRLLQPYYLAVLSPAIGALVGIGAVTAWRAGRLARVGAAAAVVLLIGYHLWLLPGTGAGRPGWLVLVLVVAAAAALAAVVLAAGHRRVLPAFLAAAAALLAPAVTAGTATGKTLGPFDAPYQPAYYTAYTRVLVSSPQETRTVTLPALLRVRGGAKYLLATSNGALAANIIYVSGEEVLPIGGVTGTFPSPTVDQLRAIVAAGQVHLVVAIAGTDDPRIAWVQAHCLTLVGGTVAGTIAEYECSPQNAN